MRTFNVELVKEALARYDKSPKDLDVSFWLANRWNVALTNDRGDVALFERQPSNPKIMSGHYFFVSRGRDAVTAGKEFLKEIFEDKYDVTTIVGFTPLEHKGALWLNKRLGFKSLGPIETDFGTCDAVMLAKQEWKD